MKRLLSVIILSLFCAAIYAENFLPVKKEGLWGYANERGEIKIKHQFAEAGEFIRGEAVVKDFDAATYTFKYGVLRSDGTMAIKPKYDFIGELREKRRVYRVNNGGSWRFGYLEEGGRSLTEAVFNEAHPFFGGLALVKIEGKYGYIGIDGKIRIKPVYDKGEYFREGFARVEIEQKSIYINTKGERISLDKYLDGGSFSDGVARVRKENGWSYIDTSGREVVGQGFEWCGDFADGAAPVKKGGYFGYINKKGENITPYIYDFAKKFNEGLAAVEKSKKTIYINNAGKQIIEGEFDEGGDFKDGIAKVKKGGKTLYIDKTGKSISDSVFSDGEDFNNGIAAAVLNGKTVYIKRDGKIVYIDGISQFKKREMIKDLEILKQDAFEYADKKNANTPLVTDKYSELLWNYYNDKYFSPWEMKITDQKRGDIAWAVRNFKKNPGFGENKLEHSGEWIDKIIQNVQETAYPAVTGKAIIVRNTNMRLLPTEKAVYGDFDTAGEGFPFDNLQNSAISVNTPVYVSHISEDKEWYFVDGPFCSGWVNVYDLAFVDDEFIKEWKKNKLGIVSKDDTIILKDDGKFAVKADTGALFPIAAYGENEIEILVTAVNSDRRGEVRKGKISRGAFEPKPAALTQGNMAQKINEMMGQQYGWGGLYDSRDCSSTLRDLLTNFGVWMPRNSAEQAKNGIYISLKSLKPEDREKMILENGTPFLTLIWMKGHIMLYVGAESGRALIFHNIWGLKTKDIYGKEGRRIIGKSVITTLEPGKEAADVYQSILARIEGMTILVPPKIMQDIME